MSDRKKMFRMTIAGLIVAASLSALAMTPPISQSDLKREADLIVRGQIVDIQCAPQGFEQTQRATWTWYIATLEVNTLKKGRWPGKRIPILFKDIAYVHGATGDADHIHHVGERGFYYLVSRGDGNWAPINWSAVDVKHPGAGPLPACR